MLKKTAAISAIVLAVCLIAFFALSPLAVSDAVTLAQQAAPAYAMLTELSQYSAENVQAVTLTGSWASLLEVRPSSDNKIRILTDNYSVASPVFKPRPLSGGMLELYCVFESPSSISLLTRENIQRLIVAHLNNAPLRRIILELPPTVAFKPGEYGASYYAYYNLSIDERVTVLVPEDATLSEEVSEPDIPYPSTPPIDGPSLPEEAPTFKSSEAASGPEESASSEQAPAV